MLKRRTLIQRAVKGSIGGLVATTLPPSLFAQSAISSRRLSDNIYLLQGAGCNVVLSEQNNGLLVIDGGLQQHAQDLLQAIQNLIPGKDIVAAFNTNWRPEHCGLNYELSEDVPIMAHENTRLWQTTDPWVEWEDKQYQPLPVFAQANQGFYKGGSLTLDNDTLDYERLPKAHTDGDIYLYFQQADVLIVSDLLAVDRFPVIDYATGGWIRGLRDATAALLEIAGENTQIIAADGPVQSRADLEAQHAMLEETWTASQNAFRNGMSVEEFQASNPVAAYTEERGDPTLFLQQVYRSTWYHMAERTVPGII